MPPQKHSSAVMKESSLSFMGGENGHKQRTEKLIYKIN